MDRLEAMAVLVAAVDGGSLSAAGRKLGMPLATVSRKISDLESHLKTRLLSRSTRQLSLTDAGRDYVDCCRRILEQVGEAERAASGEYSAPRGELVITAPIVFGRRHVLPLGIEFLRAYPEVDLRFSFRDRVVNLLEEHVDMAVRIGELPDSSLIAVRVGMVRRVVCASPDYLARRGIPQQPADLQAHDCITFEGMAGSQAWDFLDDGSPLTVPVHSRMTINTAESAIDAALAGVGLTRVLSYQVAEALHSGALVRVLPAFEPRALPVSLVYASQGRLPLKLRAFIDYALPRLRQRLEH